MKTLKEYKKEQMKNPEFVEAYEEIQPCPVGGHGQP